MSQVTEGVVAANIAGRIRVIRGLRVLLDSDLAALYGVTTKAFNQAVRRNRERFPGDFVVQLTESEAESSRSQTVTLKPGRGHNIKYLPMAFTEHGAIMAATILNSSRAIEMSVFVVRAFVRFRSIVESHANVARELDALKNSVATLDAVTRRQFEQVHEAILGLMHPAGRRQ